MLPSVWTICASPSLYDCRIGKVSVIWLCANTVTSNDWLGVPLPFVIDEMWSPYCWNSCCATRSSSELPPGDELNDSCEFCGPTITANGTEKLNVSVSL